MGLKLIFHRGLDFHLNPDAFSVMLVDLLTTETLDRCPPPCKRTGSAKGPQHGTVPSEAYGLLFHGLGWVYPTAAAYRGISEHIHNRTSVVACDTRADRKWGFLHERQFRIDKNA